MYFSLEIPKDIHRQKLLDFLQRDLFRRDYVHPGYQQLFPLIYSSLDRNGLSLGQERKVQTSRRPTQHSSACHSQLFVGEQGCIIHGSSEISHKQRGRNDQCSSTLVSPYYSEASFCIHQKQEEESH